MGHSRIPSSDSPKSEATPDVEFFHFHLAPGKGGRKA